MTPQEKNVFGKLSTKTELGSHKVELALIDEIKNDVNKNAISMQDDIIKIANFYQQKAIFARTTIKKIDSALTAAKELGINDVIRSLVAAQVAVQGQIKEGEKISAILKTAK